VGLVAIWKRLRYYQRSFGTRQTAMLYGARATRRPLIELRVPGMPHPIACRPAEPDRFTICHVFVEHDCDLPVPVNPRFIVDAGANVGYVSAYYASRFPEADIVGLEPDAGNLAVARRNCRPYPRVELLQAGLWPRDAALQIVDPKVRSWEFRVREAEAGEPDSVAGVSIPTLLGRSGHDRIDILKLDIEGSEEPLFSSPDCLNWLPAVDVVVVELHGESAERAVTGAMEGSSFSLVAVHPRRGNVYVNRRLLS
jgi:FkbM family methyltransferase